MKKYRLTLAALLLVPVGGAFALQDTKDKRPTDASAKTADDPLMMKMKAFATPGPEHKVLENKVGRWTAQVKAWSEPGKEPQTSTGTSDVKWIFDGRFIEDNVTGTFMGQPFQGKGICGYDNIKKKYVSSWVDNMGTGVYYHEGTWDPAAKTFTFTGEGPDVLTGKYVKGRSVEKMVDADHWTIQGFHPGPDGKEFMCMEIQLTRAK
jgi:hypothetical protein